MLQVSFKSKCLTILLFFILSISIGFGQTAITAANTSYNSATQGVTYNNSGAPGSPLAGNTYTYNYGNLSGTTNNSRQLNSFTAAGNTLSFITIPGQFVKIRRVNNPVVSGTRSLRYSEGNITGTTINIANEYNDDMEVFFNGNINFNSGSDNLFANQGDGNGNNNNIERLDVIFPTGISSRDNTRLGFSIFERGVVNAHDPVKVAVILSVSGTTPTRYSGIINVTAANYGTTNPVADANYVIMRRDPATETVMKASTTSLQGVGGVFLRLSDFGIANNTTIYGYSIIPNDFRGTTSAQIIDYTNASLYPTNTSGATGTGGIDLVSSTGAFQNGNVVNGGISGTVFNDVNGLSNSLVDGTGTNVSGAINAILVNAAGNVVATTIVNNNGTYSFGMIPAGTYTVRISVNAGSIGAAAPAVVLPAGWVNTGEGTTAAGDGTANGITNSFVFNGTSLTNVNFGIEQTPSPANLTAASQVNPGGTVSVTVPAATFGATDLSGGTITSVRISAFPTNATSITINGTNYTSATFPVGGITVPANAAGQPTQPITIDPVNGAVTAVITYYAIDNAGKESLTTGTASMPFTTVTVSGNVYNDVNGLTNSLVDGTGTNAGGLNAILVDNSGNVVSSTAVAANGSYTFSGVNGGNYSVRISTNAGTAGAPAPAVALPAGWVHTGEGTTTAGDGTVNGITNTFTVSTANITNVNFGIEQLPTPSVLIAPSQANPGLITSVTVPAATFGATDPSNGTISSIRISSFPTNATSITINGIIYIAATFPAAGVIVPTNAAGQPTQTIAIDPIDGSVTSVITYYATDNAGKESLTTGTASMPFLVTLSGNVYNDVNGLTNSLVDGTGTNAGGLNAILVNTTGNVVATTPVAADGTYSFNVPVAGDYTVRITTASGTVGLAAPAVALPAGWVTTGEGTAAAGDGDVNGITAVTVAAVNVTGVNFGIEQTPVPDNLTAASQVNPGGTVSVTVPAATFSATDPSGGTITSIRISAFPTNATSITINGTNYTAATFPVGGVTVPANVAGQPTQPITIDPVDGAVTAVITYYATDNAGKESLISGTVGVPFHCAIPGLWTGDINNDWNNPGNWCSLSVPTSSTNVVIPAGATIMPSTSSTVVFNDIEIQNGATVDISNDSVTIGGIITGTGTFSTNAASALIVAGNGTGSAGTIYFTNGSNNLGNLTIQQTGTSGSVSIGSPLNIITVLNVTNGTLNTNDNITLSSNAAGTASVGPIDCNVASVNGNITVERYVSARRAWRLLGVPVAGNQTIRQAWQENTMDVLQNPYPGYGTHITGGTAANGFDQTLTNNPSIRKYNQALFSFTSTPLTSTNLPMNNENGYFVLVRGDRSTDLTTNTPAATPTVLRTTGTLRSCIQTYPTIQGICNFIGNPYPSSIDFTKLTRVNIPNRFFLWDPYLNSVGGYQTFDSSNNWVPVPGGGSYGNTPNTIIQSGQAFFVQGTIGSGSLTINEDAKVIGAANNTFFRPSSVQQKIGITLNTVNSTGTVMNDGLLAIFDDAYSAAFDNNDARKMTNVDEIFSLIRENKLLSIEKRPGIATDDTLFIKAYRLKIKNYQLKIQPQQFDGSLLAYLDDAYTQSSTPIDLIQESVYNFTVTADSNSSNSSRFRIVFKPAVVLPIKFVSVSATVINNDIKVSWTTAAAASVVTYTIESSADGQHFSTAGTVLPNNTGTYQWLDVNTTAGNHYYRIKATEANGTVYYSNVTFIKAKVKEPLLTVFPNPISGEFFTFKAAHLPAGTYSVKLYDNIGQVLYTDKIVSTGSYISKQIATRVLLSKGIYRLVITNNDIVLSQSINYN